MSAHEQERPHVDKYIEALREFLRQPSISAQDRGVKECAQMLSEMMNRFGISSKLVPVKDGQPVVLGELKSGRADRTLLIYDHYDVQPPEPLDEWIHPPFSADLEDERIWSRGASDSKGNILAYLAAADVILRRGKELPINLKFIFEGEEEIGSPHLPEFVENNKDLLRADAVVCCDGGLDPSGSPVISLGLKGILYVEMRCSAAKTDLHSSRAPLVTNPAWRLVWALNTLKDRDGRIIVPGWLDDVKVPTTSDLEIADRIPFDEMKLKEEYGVKELLGGKVGADALRSLLFDPTCTICGFLTGYTGPKSKTVLPKSAFAKIDFRLVYDQDPDDLFRKLRKHLEAQGFADIEIDMLGRLEPSRTPPTASIVRAAAKAARNVYGVEPVICPNSPGSGPDYLFTKKLKMDSIWTGCAPAFSNAHAPNEFITRSSLASGIRYAVETIENFADPKL